MKRMIKYLETLMEKENQTELDARYFQRVAMMVMKAQEKMMRAMTEKMKRE